MSILPLCICFVLKGTQLESSLFSTEHRSLLTQRWLVPWFPTPPQCCQRAARGQCFREHTFYWNPSDYKALLPDFIRILQSDAQIQVFSPLPLITYSHQISEKGWADGLLWFLCTADNQANVHPKHAAPVHMNTYHTSSLIRESLHNYQTVESRMTIDTLCFRMSSEGHNKMGRQPQE